jgi:hypothetical protein
MGVEARYQAIPEDCDLLARARSDRETAEWMEFFHATVVSKATQASAETPEEIAITSAVLALAQERPGLIERYFYAGNRRYDHLVYLLSPARRRNEFAENDHSLIHKAVHGSERLHPEARATQGRSIGFVPADDVQTIADYLATITRDMLHEHYDPAKMFDSYVYKTDPGMSEDSFEVTWQEFEGMRRVYQQAAAHGEAMITVID